MMFETVPNKYRPIPFWSWNEKLDRDSTVKQVRMMHQVGIGGFFMHARGGLETQYMGDEWFSNVDCALETAEELCMDGWVYDENGWPSGFGDGKINGKGDSFCQKILRIEKNAIHKENSICMSGGFHFYYEINPYYVDNLDGKVVADFIKEIYEPYYKRFKGRIKGFFTDEPQICRSGIPWSLTLPSAYSEEYGEDLLLHIAELFLEIGDYKQTRIKFWRLVCMLFSKNYVKQIYDWCIGHNLEFTGHFLMEESMREQISANGAVMPHYEYFTMPGVDWLGRNVRDCLTARQVGSVAAQLGKKHVLTESFALCGHNVGFEELKRIYEWQAVRGVNMLCQHLQGYSMRGIRKRDFPPAMFYQQPWWDEYKVFNDTVSRTGMILAEGREECDVLLMHPQTTAWSLYSEGENDEILELDKRFLEDIKTLESKHIEFHLGDEILMERHAKVSGDKLVIGKMSYSTVILRQDMLLLDNTKKLFCEFTQNGGKIVTVCDIPPNDIIDSPDISYTKRVFDGYSVYYFVNTLDKTVNARVRKGSKMINASDGTMSEFDGTFTFAPYESLLVIDDGSEQKTEKKKSFNELIVDGEWDIVSKTPNVMTLDRCDYYFDGELQERNGYVLNIQKRACDLKRKVKIRQEFVVNSRIKPKSIYLVAEKPENSVITVNGIKVSNKPVGKFIDSSFEMIAIDGCFGVGDNRIVIETDFSQSDKVYENLDKSYIFESEKNKLTYDMEIEPVYLAGDFGVYMDGEIERLQRGAIRFSGSFYIDESKSTINLLGIEQQGFPFFAGKITVQKRITVRNTEKVLKFNKKGVNAIEVSVNGKKAGNILWNPTECNISEFLEPGENLLEITLINNLRNMLGPHHLDEGESYTVRPANFFKEPCVWTQSPMKWNDGYCFVEFGIV